MKLNAVFKSVKPLQTKVVEGRKADEDLIRDMWRLRLDFLRLTTSEEQDWQKFRDVCIREKTILITFLDDKGTLQGYFTFCFKPIDHEDRKALLVHSKYYYVRPEYRGHPKITSSAWPLLPGMIWRYGFRRIYFVAFSFPTSYVSLTRTFGHSMPIQSDTTPAWEKSVLEQFAKDSVGMDWDSQNKLIVNQNIPFGEDRPPSASVKDLRSTFEAYNPNWSEGKSMPIMMRFDLGMVKSVLSTSLRRQKRS